MLAFVLCQTTMCTLRHNPQMKYTPTAAKKLKDNCKTESIKLHPPTTKEEIRRQIIEGKDALFNNLPHPEVKNLGVNHSYILPSECIADLAAHGKLDFKAKRTVVQSLGESYLATKLQKEDSKSNTKSVFLSLWSDDFDPNYSTKNNRGSVWIMTMCIQTTKSGNPGLHSIYPVAIGDSKENHRDISEIILDDIKNLHYSGSGDNIIMWNQATKKNEKINVHLLSLQQDQPERRKFTGLLCGGEGTHPRWGWLAVVAKFVDTIIPCQKCRKMLKKHYIDNTFWEPVECIDCHNWMQFPHLMKFEPFESDEFPEEEFDGPGSSSFVSLVFVLSVWYLFCQSGWVFVFSVWYFVRC